MKVRIILAALAITLTAGACGSSPEPAQERNACLYAAVRAYPAWTASKVPVLDGVPECKNLGPDQKAELRKIMAEFVMSASDR